jgi:hypothetical protein
LKKPDPAYLACELDWIFLHVDANPIFMHSAETIRELLLENERLRVDKGFTPPERVVIESTWG